MKKQKKLPDPQYNYGGFIPTNETETKYYPFGGLINQGVTTIASALGANDKTAQLIGSGVATATGLIPGMQDNFLQAGDLVGDIGTATGDKNLQKVGQVSSALAPLAGMFMAYGGNIEPPNPPTHEEFMGEQNPYYTTKRDLSSMKAMGRDPKTTLVKHISDKDIEFTSMKSEADKQAIIDQYQMQIDINNLWNQYDHAKVITPKGITPVKKAMGGELTEFEGNTHENGGVPLGNSNVEVEGGETKHENYIFSDRIKLPWNKKSTFSDESKRIEKKYKDLTTDPLAQKSKKVEMDKLRDAQEVVKGEMMKKAQKMMGDAGMHQMPDGSMMQGKMGLGGTLMKPLGEAVGDLSPEKQQQFGNIVNGVMNVAKFIPGVGQIVAPIQSMMNSQLPQNQMQMAYGGKIYYPPDGGTPIVDENYGINQFKMIPNQDNNYLGKENWQYEREGSIPNSRLSKNYTSEEQIAIQGLSNQLNSGVITKQQYNEALAAMGNNDGFNASHVNPAYTDQFNQQKSETTPSDLAQLANRMGQTGSNQNGNNGSGTGTFDDQLRWDEKLMPFLPVAGQALTLIGGPEKTQYQQAKANLVDLKPQRTAAEKQAAIARLVANQNVRNIAGNSGRALSNIVTSNAAIQSNVSDQLAQSYMNEANANAQILNQTGMFNTQIQNEQTNANEANKSKFQEQAIATLANLAGTYSGVGKDQRAYKNQNAFNTMAAENLGTNNYGFYVDENGVVRTKFKVV